MKGKNELIDNKKELKLIPIVTLLLSNCALAENPCVTAMWQQRIIIIMKIHWMGKSFECAFVKNWTSNDNNTEQQ